MYTKVYHSLKNLNLYAKAISLLFIILSIFLVDNVLLVASIIILSILLSGLLKNFEALQLSIILVIIFMFYYLHPFLFIIVKLLLLYVWYLIVKAMITEREKRYFLDKLFYKSHSKRTMNLYLNQCYKNKLFAQNLNVYDNIDKYTRRKYSDYIIKQAKIKTNYDIQDIYYRNRLNYYKFYDHKTTFLNMSWHSWDNTLLIISFCLFLLVLFYR